MSSPGERMTDPLALSAIEARVLGALLEKERSTPDAYPLTLNALTGACNQTSNRDPVVRYERADVERAVLGLKLKGLTRIVHPGSGERSTRYRHVAGETLGLGPADLSLVASLLLRGAQTAAELRTRTERLHPFASAAEVEGALDGLARRDPPLTARVERQPGQKEGRWIQLLEVGVEERAAAGAARSGGDAAIAARSPGRLDELEERVAALEAQLAELLESLGGQGGPDR